MLCMECTVILLPSLLAAATAAFVRQYPLSEDGPNILASDDFEMGTTVSLVCQTTVKYDQLSEEMFVDYPLSWTRRSSPGRTIAPNNQTSNSLGNTIIYYSQLHVKVTEDLDMDEFICTSELSDPSKQSGFGVQVIRPSKPMIRAGRKFVLGTEVPITCRQMTRADVTGFPLTWTLNSDPNNRIMADESTVPVQRALVSYCSIVKVRAEKSVNLDVFTCKAAFSGIVLSSSWTVVVVIPPKDPVISGPTQVPGGKASQWTCEVDGASGTPPHIQWQHDVTGAESLVQDLPVKTYPDPDSHTYKDEESVLDLHKVRTNFKMTPPVRRDEYTIILLCMAQHNDSNTSTVANYTVTVGKPPFVLGGPNHTVNVGQNVTIDCIVKSDSDIISVTWYKDGTNLMLEENMHPITKNGDTENSKHGTFPISSSLPRYIGGTVRTPSLTIKQAEQHDNGNYMCVVTNTYGEGQGSASLVTVAHFLTTNCPLAVEEGTDLSCSCQTTLPGVTVTWPDYSESAELNVTGISIQDDGTRFTCLALGSSQSVAIQYLLQVMHKGALRRREEHQIGEPVSSGQFPGAIVAIVAVLLVVVLVVLAVWCMVHRRRAAAANRQEAKAVMAQGKEP